MNKNFLILGIAVLLIVVGLSGCTQQTLTEQDIEEQQSEEIYQNLMNNKIGVSTISEILDATIELWNSIGGNAYSYGGYATHIEGDLWEVGVYINADGDVTKYSWQYNVTTDEETPLSSAAQKLYKSDEEEIPEPEIIDHDSYSSGDFVYVFGTIKNIASVNIEYLKLTITLYDLGNNVIKSDFTYAHPTVIEPGMTACFKQIFSDTPYYDHYKIKVDSFEQFGIQPYHDLITTDVHDSVGSLGYEVSGNIKNIGSDVLPGVSIYAIFYDSNGKIIDVESDWISKLYAGQEESFRITVYDSHISPGIISDYELKIDYY